MASIMRGVQNQHLKNPNQTAGKTPKLCNPMSKSSMNQTPRSDGILDPGIIYSPAPPPRTHKRKKNPYHQKEALCRCGIWSYPTKAKKKRVLSSLSTDRQQPASLVDVQTMPKKKQKKKPHLVSLEPPNLNLCLSRSPLGTLSRKFSKTNIVLLQMKRQREKKKRRNKTYLPSSSQNRNSHGECDSNCRKHKGGHVEESLRPFSPKQNKPHVFFFFFFPSAATEESQILPFPSSTPQQAPPPSPALATHPSPLPPHNEGENLANPMQCSKALAAL